MHLRTALLALSVLLASAATAADTPAAQFDPIRFFEGRTQGRGALKIIMRAAQPVAVEGLGRVEPDGTLVLSQQVTQGLTAPRTREWRIRQVAPGRYVGSLSDAVGPVTGEAEGRTLTLRFPGKGAAIEQVLTLADDGRSARNVLTARKMGVRIAVLDETITRLD